MSSEDHPQDSKYYTILERELEIGDYTFWPKGDDAYWSGKWVLVNQSCIDWLYALDCKPHKLLTPENK